MTDKFIQILVLKYFIEISENEKKVGSILLINTQRWRFWGKP